MNVERLVPDLEALDGVAAELWDQLAGMTSPVVACQGPLGAGKTTLAQAVVRQGGCPDRLTSPTYALVQSYHWGGTTFHHLDAYRLGSAEEVFLSGWMPKESEGISWIEWPERLMPWLASYWDIWLTLAYEPRGGRRLHWRMRS